MARIDESKSANDPLIGHTIAGRYQLERRIGSGGMGFVYRAKQLDQDRKVALKMLHNELSDNSEIKQRFHREMRAATKIEHPNSVRVVDYGEHEGKLFLVMELCEGRSLDEVIQQESPFNPVRTAVIGMQIAQGLAAAHAEKVVHRDLKPENVMLVERYGQADIVKVLDFGLARVGQDDTDSTDAGRLTAAGVRVGTPTYMAPEYVQAFTFDHRSDLYALGVLMYEMSTGRAPYTGRPFEILEQAVTKNPVPPSQLNPDGAPPWLERCILKLMQKNPKDRIQTATEVFHLLDRGRSEMFSTPGGDVTKVADQATVVQNASTLTADPPTGSGKKPSAPAQPSPALAKARRSASQAGAGQPVVVQQQGGLDYGVVVAGCGLVALIASAGLLSITVILAMLWK